MISRVPFLRVPSRRRRVRVRLRTRRSIFAPSRVRIRRHGTGVLVARVEARAKYIHSAGVRNVVNSRVILYVRVAVIRHMQRLRVAICHVVDQT